MATKSRIKIRIYREQNGDEYWHSGDLLRAIGKGIREYGSGMSPEFRSGTEAILEWLETIETDSAAS